jgi:hypothetical protein
MQPEMYRHGNISTSATTGSAFFGVDFGAR